MKDVLTDSEIDVPDPDECVDTFTVNVKDLDLLRTIGGLEALVSIGQVMEELPNDDTGPMQSRSAVPSTVDITYAAAVAVLPTPAAHSQSPILAASGEEMFGKAIALTLEAPLDRRAELVERLLQNIVAIVSANPEMRPWTYNKHSGSDGSWIFSGGIGLSLVVDTEGRLWRARTYEDFETTHRVTATSCEVESMTPKYDQMREYRRL